MTLRATNRACARRTGRVLGLVFPAFLLVPAAVAAQAATVRTRDNVRATPNGDVVAQVEPGTKLTTVGRQDRWLEVELEGWVWMRSLQVVSSGGHDLIVSAPEGENLRAQPSGGIVGRLGKGTLLDERERIPGWVRATRRGWIWAESVDVAGAATTKAAPTPAPAPPTRAAAAAPASGAAILAGPNGDTLARMRPGAQLQVLARQGSWARVRVEGWAWLPALDSAAGATVVKVDAGALAADPESFRGRVVSWDLQFLSLERAERIRTDFFEGEPFLLTRHSGGGYVYVAVPPERLAEVRTLLPLERVTVVGRMRSPASALTGSPILDLIELKRSR